MTMQEVIHRVRDLDMRLCQIESSSEPKEPCMDDWEPATTEEQRVFNRGFRILGLCILMFVAGLITPLWIMRAERVAEYETVEKYEYTTITMNVSAYCPCEICCGIWATKGVNSDGVRITASGAVADGSFIAAPPIYGFGTMMLIPGYAGGEWVPVLDRGGAITVGTDGGLDRLDVFFDSHDKAVDFGRREVEVMVRV